MATLNYSQTGITADMAEDIRRRQRARGVPAPYGPSVTGLTEQDTETAVNRANVTGEDAGQAVQAVRAAADARVKRPAPGPHPGRMAADARDRQMMEQAQRRQRVLSAVGAITTLFGSRENDASRNALLQQAREANDPMQYQAAIDARREEDVATRAAKDEARIAEEERALNADYRQTLMRSMDVNANRREAEMGRTSERDARSYDPNHPVAQQRREFLRRIMASAPGMAQAFAGQDLDALGAVELSRIADQMLRRIGQVPARYRQTDVDALMQMAADLDAGDAPAEQSVTQVPAPAAGPRARMPRRQGAPAAAPAAPPAQGLTAGQTSVFQQPAEAMPAQPTAPAGITDRAGAPAPWAGRNRTVAQMNAETLMQRNPGEYTWGEALDIARGLERSRTRTAASLAGGIDTQSREAQRDQVTQVGAFTQRDINQAAEILAPIASQRSMLSRAARQVQGLSDAQFAAAMSDSAFLQRLMNVEEFTGLFAQMTNSELRRQSGAAVTDAEARRFFRALSSNQLNSKQAFLAALRSVDREAQQNASRFVPRAELRSAWASQVRGSR
jgi:hypothetical protein